MALNPLKLMCRPWSCDRPRVQGVRPQINGEVKRVSRSKRHARTNWRCTVSVNDATLYMSHHDSREAAEHVCVKMIEAYVDIHYIRT